MSGNSCIVCPKKFLSRVGFSTHLKNHIENALSSNAGTRHITTIVAEVESPKSSVEIKTKIVQINVSATTVTQTSESGNVITLQRLNPGITRILSINTYKPVASSKSKSADGTSSPDMDTHENTSNSDAAPAALVEEKTHKSLESRSVGGTSSTEIEIIETTSRRESETVEATFSRESETIITQTIYESSGSASADETSSPPHMSQYKCLVCKNKGFSSQNGFLIHLSIHIKNALSAHARISETTAIVVEVESPESSMETRTKLVELNVTATTITESSESGNVDISLQRLYPRIVRIISEYTFVDLTVESSESESDIETSSADMDANENTSNSDAAPTTLVVGTTDESFESRNVGGTSSTEMDIVKTTSTIVPSEVIIRRESETKITETIYGSSGSGSVHRTSSPRHMSRHKCIYCDDKSFVSQKAFFTHLKSHIEKAQSAHARTGETTKLVVVVESPESSMETRNKIVEINVTATTVTETSESGNILISLRRLNPRIITILSESKTRASSKSASVEQAASVRNISNSNAAPN